MIRANFDYEMELFSGTSNLKINQEFEYLYWWAEDNLLSLSTNYSYPEQYLDYVQSLVKGEVSISKDKGQLNWWGELVDLKTEKVLNSKITSTQFAIEKNLCHPKTKIVTSQEEIQHLKNDYYVLKNPYLMSGKGFKKFRGDHFTEEVKSWANKQFMTSPLILEPWLRKKEDFSSYVFLQESKVETYFNYSNEQGNYKGTIVFSNPASIFEELEKCGVNLDYYFKFIEIVSDYYTTLGAKTGMSLDSFTYEEEGFKKVYLLSEVNYRKTMGWVALKLKKYLPSDGIGQLILVKRQKTYESFEQYKMSFKNFLYEKDSHEGIILLSHHQNQFLTFFVAAKTEPQLSLYKDFLDKL
jgi:hypothetical protein